MLINEARWLGDRLGGHAAQAVSPVLNIGSGTSEFREVLQPFIQQYIIGPLESRGVSFIHLDQKSGPGIDLHGDIYDPELQRKIRALSPKAVMCCNMLEHVRDREKLANLLTDFLPPDGILVLTVPHSFPYHADPIDTLYRPDVEQLAKLFPRFTVVEAGIVDCGSYGHLLKNRPALIPRHIARSLFPFPGFFRWLNGLHRWTWLFRPYQVTCYIGRKSG